MFHATFDNISVGGQFYWWKKPDYPKKTMTCRKSLTKCCIEYTSPVQDSNSQI
jgi:hypothetical protein